MSSPNNYTLQAVLLVGLQKNGHHVYRVGKVCRSEHVRIGRSLKLISLEHIENLADNARGKKTP